MIRQIINYRSNRAIQEQVNKYAIEKSKHDARQDYEYKAKIRLYEDFDPYMFQFMELCEASRRAILRIAEWSREGRLEERLKDFGSSGNKLRKTMYDLFAPIAAFTIFRNKLTLFDLSLVPLIRIHYSVAKLIFYIFDDDNEFALLKPAIQYKYLNQPVIIGTVWLVSWRALVNKTR